MSPKVTKVLKGFHVLSDAERNELIAEINKYLKGNTALREVLKRDISESIEKSASVNFGPAPGGCPCCGR